MPHFAPIIIFIVIALANMLKVAMKSAKTSGPQTPRPQARPDSELERARRFREALGLPPDAAAPKPVRGRVPANPPPLLPVNPPVVVLVPGQLRRVRVDPPAPAMPVPSSPPPAAPVPPPISPLAPSPDPARVTPPPAPAAPRPLSQDTTRAYRRDARQTGLQKTEAASVSSQGILALLRVQGTARNAIILREVLGPPKALA